MRSREHLLTAVVCLCTALSSLAAEVTSGESLLRAMHARYEKSWYQTLTFVQKSSTYNPDHTTKVETWYEAASVPGKLRIDFGRPSAGNGVLLLNGTAYFYKDGKEAGTRPLLNLLLVLGFDVYRQSPELTLIQLKGEGIDTRKIHEEQWQGQPVYVVGADKGDLKSKQFWVEKKSLLFVRLIEPGQRDPSKIEDTRFLDYRAVDGGMVAARVELFRDGKLVFSEDYSEIRAGVKLDPAIFDPQQFTTHHWEE